MKYIVERMDIVSKKRYPLLKLIRIVFTDDGYIIDVNHKVKSRGYYILKDSDTISILKKKPKIISRYYKGDISYLINDLEKCLTD